MRLKTNNIKFVKELTHNGITYEWFVAMKSNSVSDARMFVNHENGRTILAEYPKEMLPKTVQKFLEGCTAEELESRGDYITYIHK